MTMEFLVEFEVAVPDGTSEAEVEQRNRAEAVAAAGLAADGHLLRLWRTAATAGDRAAVGLYAADSRAELDALLRALPLVDWMQVTVVPLAPHPNDPGLDV
jgi:muconolactone D-isomerase